MHVLLFTNTFEGMTTIYDFSIKAIPKQKCVINNKKSIIKIYKCNDAEGKENEPMNETQNKQTNKLSVRDNYINEQELKTCH